MKLTLVLLGVFSVWPALAQSGTTIGRIAELNGSAQLNEGERSLIVESPVHAGDRITTRAGSRARILFDDQTAIQLNPDTEVKLVRVGKGATIIQLAHGGVVARVKPQPKKSIAPRFMIRTRTAVMGVRGTTLFVQQEAAKPVFLCVCEGEVDITWRGHKTTRSSRHHDSPVWLDQARASMTPDAQGIAHNDADAAALGDLLGLSTP